MSLRCRTIAVRMRSNAADSPRRKHGAERREIMWAAAASCGACSVRWVRWCPCHQWGKEWVLYGRGGVGLDPPGMPLGVLNRGVGLDPGARKG